MSDETLIRAVTGGDTRAFEQLVQRHESMVAKFIWRLVPMNEDREEVCQDVFVKVYMNLDRFKFDSKFSTWLYSIAYRTAISFLRKRKYEFEELEEQFDTAQSTQNDVEDSEIGVLLAGEIRKLGIDERTIVTLFHVQGCGVDEIAGIMGKPPGTIKSILFRVRKKLKDRLMPVLGDLEGFGEAAS